VGRRPPADADPSHLGLLIAEGVLAREVVLGDTVSTELLGPGDIVRPGTSRVRRSCCRSRSAGTRSRAIRLALIDRRTAPRSAATRRSRR
jgi:hypothetical protein